MNLGVTFTSSRLNLSAFVDDANFVSDCHPSLKLLDLSPDLLLGQHSSELNLKKEQYYRHKSTTGCLAQLYGNWIAYICQKQLYIKTSKTEAEAVAVAKASSLIVFLES